MSLIAHVISAATHETSDTGPDSLGHAGGAAKSAPHPGSSSFKPEVLQVIHENQSRDGSGSASGEGEQALPCHAQRLEYQ